jgi:hypothetical protein
MAKYRIINEKGAYLALSPEVRPVDFGDTQSTNAYAIRAQLCQYCPQGPRLKARTSYSGPTSRGLDRLVNRIAAAFRLVGYRLVARKTISLACQQMTQAAPRRPGPPLTGQPIQTLSYSAEISLLV